MTLADVEWRRDRVAYLTGRGWTVPQIAAGLGCTTRTVQRARKLRGCSGQSGKPYTERELRWARELLEDGASYNEVAATLGRARTWLAQRLPGYTLTRDQMSERAVAGQMFARISRQWGAA